MEKIIALSVLITAAAFAVFSADLLVSALFLALSSVAASVVYYLLGAVQASIVELSVGAGLISILFIMSITLSGSRFVKTQGTRTPVRAAPTKLAGFWLAVTVLVALTYSIVSSRAFGPSAAAITASPDVSPVLWGNETGYIYYIMFVILSSGIGLATLFGKGGSTR